MKRGDVVSMKSCRVYSGRSWFEFKPPGKGETFVFVMLGVESEANPLDPVAAIEALGWSKSTAAASTRSAQVGSPEGSAGSVDSDPKGDGA